MSAAEILRNIAFRLETRAEPVTTREQALASLVQTVSVSAQHLADLVFLKLSTEPGWTSDEARGLAERALDGHAQAIAQTVHGLGGTADLALQLGAAAFDAFRNRLVELHASQGVGGVA